MNKRRWRNDNFLLLFCNNVSKDVSDISWNIASLDFVLLIRWYKEILLAIRVIIIRLVYIISVYYRFLSLLIEPDDWRLLSVIISDPLYDVTCSWFIESNFSR